MSARSVGQCNSCSKFSTIHLVLAAVLLLCAVDSAHAIANVPAPMGWGPGRVYIGVNAWGDVYVYYRDGLSGSGTCSARHKIGDWASGGLYERTRVHSSSGGDEFWVIYGSEVFNGCASAGWDALFPLTNGKLELWGWGGADVFYAPALNPNLQVIGEDGADMAFVGEAYIVDGGNNDDKLIALGAVAPTSTTLFGSNGTDRLCAYGSGAIWRMDGGAGTDWGWYAGDAPTNVDSTEGHALGSDCDAASATISARISD